MKPTTQNILNDIFIIEPELKQHEPEIIAIVEKLLSEKPDTKFDIEFAKNLRKKIIEKQKTEHLPWYKKILLPGAALIFSGTAIIIALVVLLPDGLTKIIPEKNNNGFTNNIQKVGQNGFGKIAISSESQDTANYSSLALAEETSSRTALGMGGETTIAPVVDAANGKIMSSISMPAYTTDYLYEYIGGEIILPEGNLPVYKKEKNSEVSGQLSQIISGFNFGLISADKFIDSKIDSFVLSENREFGYTVYFNLSENMVNINSNWQKWPQIGKECQDTACWEKYNLTEKDVPSDEELVSIADEFVKKYSLDMSFYNPGIVNQNQRLYYAQEKNDRAQNVYVPENFSVIYPLKVADTEVFETSGDPVGLSVNINIRHKKVSDVGNIVPSSYLSSEYELEKDTTKLIARAEDGGFYPAWHTENPEKTITLKLGDPKMGLVKYYQYNQDNNENYELYIPALIFPVTNYGEENIYQKFITVPLVKEILAENERQDNGGGIRPLTTPGTAPMIKTEAVRQ